MLIQVESRARQALPHRAIVGSILLFLLASLLAGSMAWHRSIDPLGAAFQPSSWGMSVRLPRRFHRTGELQMGDGGEAHVFEGHPSVGGSVRLVLWRLLVGRDVDAGQMAMEAVGWHLSTEADDRVLFNLPLPTANIGRKSGTEVVGPDRKTIARAIVLPNGDAYVISMSTQAEPFHEDLLALFEMTCRSAIFFDR